MVAAVAHAGQLTYVLAASGILALPGRCRRPRLQMVLPRDRPNAAGSLRRSGPSDLFSGRARSSSQEKCVGLTLAPLSKDLIDKFSIEKRLNGVVVTQVDANSEAAGRGITSGDVVLQTNQEVILTPDDVVRSVESATKDGHKTILLLLSNARGETQSISLSLG